MSYTMTHLLIAHMVAKEWDISDPEMFYLGAIAPDAVHNREDFTFLLKAQAHDLQPEAKWGEIYTEQDMLTWYGRLSRFYAARIESANTPETMSFLQGYVLHMLVDVFNCKLLYGKNLIRYGFQVERMRDRYRKECILQDHYLRQNSEGADFCLDMIWKACKREDLQNVLKTLGLEQWISADAVSKNVAYHINGYAKAEPASLEGLEMVSEASSEEFLEIVSKEAIRMLFEFPDAGRTFRVEGMDA